MKNKLLKMCLISLTVAPCVVPLTNCSLVDVLANRPRLIDGFDWTGRLTGLLSEYDDYEVNTKDKSVTYWNLGTIEAHNLVIPNYVMYRGEPYKVLLDVGAFKDGGERITGFVELNDFITKIPSCCFRNNTAITEIIFHNYPTEIGEFAFLNCYSLETIKVKKQEYVDYNWAIELTKVNVSAFDNCSLKGKLIFGPQLQAIADRAFVNCYELTDVDLTLSNRLEEIGPSAFMSCNKLTHVYLPESIKKIQRESFAVCLNLETVSFPKQGLSISLDAYAFSECKNFRGFTFKNVDVPLNLNITYAGEACFNGDLSLEPNSYLLKFEAVSDLSYYMKSVFEGCDFQGWTLDPNNVAYIESNAFAFNRNLKFIDLTRIGVNQKIPEGWIKDGTLETVDVFSYVNSFGTIFVKKGFLAGGTFASWVSWFEKQGLSFDHGDYITPSLEHWNFQEK